MRTIKQIKARKRNFTIMYLTGVLTMLDYIDKQMRNYVLKGALNSTRIINYKEQCRQRKLKLFLG